jgi:hypothetical protein
MSTEVSRRGFITGTSAGVIAAGACAETAPESLNWAAVTSGGWGESWAQWMNAGSGGAVCTRTLVYSTAQSRWIVE